MAITNRQSGTNVHEVADAIYRINTPVVIEGAGGFSFNQYLITDDEPLLFHTGPRKMFPLVREAVGSVLPVEPFATLRSPMWKPTSAARSTNGLPSLRNPYHCAARSLPWYRLVTLLIGRPACLPMESCCFWASTPCVGSIRRICRTHGNAAS